MKKSFVILCVLAMCSVVWAEEKKEAEPQKEKPDYRSVIVDAWLVRIDAEALAESGVKPLSEKDKENVSVMNLMWCLSDPNNGEILASARTQSGRNEEVKCESSRTEYIKQEFGRGMTLTPYSSRTSFKNISQILDDKKIRMEFSFELKDFDVVEPNLPAEETNVVFANIVILPDKKSVIAAQLQTGSDMFFLVMKAEIVD